MPNNKLKKLARNTFLFSIGDIGSKFISFFMVPIYTYVLSNEQYGTIDLITMASLLLSGIIIMNLCEAVMRFAMDKNADYKKISSISVLAILVAALLSVILIYPIIIALGTFKGYEIVTTIYVFTSGIYILPLIYIRGQEKIRLYASLNILLTFITALLNIVFLVILKQGINGYIFASIISESIIFIIAFFASQMYLCFKKFEIDNALMKSMLKFSVPLLPNGIIWWIINSSDRYLVTYFLGISATGIYAVAYKLPSLLTMISSIFMKAWQISVISNSDEKDKDIFSSKIFDNLLKMIFVCGSFIILILKVFMKIYVSDNYYISWKYTPLLVLAFILLSLGSFFGTFYYAAKNTLGNMLSALFGAVINIILNIILIPKIGINGASLATCVSYFIIFIYRSINTKKYIKIKILKSSYIIIFIIFILQIVFVYIEDIKGYILMCLCSMIIIWISRSLVIEIIKVAINATGRIIKRKL